MKFSVAIFCLLLCGCDVGRPASEADMLNAQKQANLHNNRFAISADGREYHCARYAVYGGANATGGGALIAGGSATAVNVGESKFRIIMFCITETPYLDREYLSCEIVCTNYSVTGNPL